ncbi:hypothetical protein U1Q18_035736 [Sarracenia purpurea var. burkii]
MDLSEKESLSEEMSEIKKCCADCKTTRTPLWRSGPAGPKSLCNACGIRYRKKSAALVGLNKGSEKRKDKPATNTTTTSTISTPVTSTTTPIPVTASNTTKSRGGNLCKDLRVRLMALGKEMAMLQRKRSPLKRQRISRKLGEEEQAAVLLMALSCGSVFA